MATTCTPGITVNAEGFRTINKEHRGERIFARLGLVCQERAERRLAQELERLEWELERRAHARPLFSDCAKRFVGVFRSQAIKRRGRRLGAAQNSPDAG